MVQSLNVIKNKLDELPNNIEAEQSVIGSILLANEIFDEISMIISNKNFYDPMHQKIFGAIEILIYSGMLSNPITLKNYFDNEKIEINPSLIQPVKEIKSLGDFKVVINLHSEVQEEIVVKVIQQEEAK